MGLCVCMLLVYSGAKLLSLCLLQESEFSQCLDVTNLSLDEHEVLVVWKWAWEDASLTDVANVEAESQSDKEEHELKDVSEGLSSDTGSDVSDAVTHSLVFKFIGSTKVTHYQDALSKAAHLIGEGKTVPISLNQIILWIQKP